MNTNFKIIGFISCLLICSCGTTLEGEFIVKYDELNYDSPRKSIRNVDRRIISFQKDSIEIKNFPLRIGYSDAEPQSYAFKLLDKALIIFKDGEPDSLGFSVLGDSISFISSTIIFNKEKKVKTYLQKFPKYNLGDKKSIFRDYLLKSSFAIDDSLLLGFKLQDSLVLEFEKNAKVLYSSINYGTNQSWMVDSYAGELFLNLDGLRDGAVLHISHFDSTGFAGTKYGRKNKEMIYHRHIVPPKFDLKMLKGNWIATEDENNDLKLKELAITDSKINQIYSTKRYEFDWHSNTDQNFLYLSRLNPKRQKVEKIWQIANLTEHELVIRRFRNIEQYRPVVLQKFRRK